MKVHITENIDMVLQDHKMIPIIYGKIDLGSLPDNSAQSIVAIDALDSIPANLIPEFFQKVSKKMRFESILTVGGLELGLLSKDVVNGKISSSDYNGLIYNKRGVYTVLDIVNILSQLNLKIESVSIKGYNYEIKATRPITTN
jgi:hypothetical protein